MNEMDMLAAAAGGMDAGRIALEAAAHNVAAAEASGPGGFSRLVPQFVTLADSSEDDAFEGAGEAVIRFAGMRSEQSSGDAMSEMVAVLDAQRAYEANASVFDAAKRFAERAVDVGRQ